VSGFELYKKITEYGVNEGYRTGVRFDFAIFSIIFGFLFEIIGMSISSLKERLKIKQCIKLYWVTLLPFFFFGFGAFSDRLLFTSWIYLSFLAAMVFSYGQVSFNGIVRPMVLLIFVVLSLNYFVNVLNIV
jgi:hypothetical protein